VNVSREYDIFSKEYEEVCGRYIRKIRIREGNRERPPWVSQEIKGLIRRKASL